MIGNEDDYLGSCLAVTLTKLVLKMKKYLKQKKSNQMGVDSILLICALIKMYQRKGKEDRDSK